MQEPAAASDDPPEARLLHALRELVAREVSEQITEQLAEVIDIDDAEAEAAAA